MRRRRAVSDEKFRSPLLVYYQTLTLKLESFGWWLIFAFFYFFEDRSLSVGTLHRFVFVAVSCGSSFERKNSVTGLAAFGSDFLQFLECRSVAQAINFLFLVQRLRL